MVAAPQQTSLATSNLADNDVVRQTGVRELKTIKCKLPQDGKIWILPKFLLLEITIAEPFPIVLISALTVVAPSDSALLKFLASGRAGQWHPNLAKLLQETTLAR